MRVIFSHLRFRVDFDWRARVLQPYCVCFQFGHFPFPRFLSSLSGSSLLVTTCHRSTIASSMLRQLLTFRSGQSIEESLEPAGTSRFQPHSLVFRSPSFFTNSHNTEMVRNGHVWQLPVPPNLGGHFCQNAEVASIGTGDYVFTELISKRQMPFRAVSNCCVAAKPR